MAKEYEVGYGKPPKEHQFKAGQSGNSDGQPKKTKRDQTDVAELLNEPIAVNKGSTTRKMSPIEASFRKLANKAVKGKDLRAAREFVQLCEKYEVITPPTAPQDGGGVLRIPNTWDQDEWMQMFKTHGPPPWPGPRSGLPA